MPNPIDLKGAWVLVTGASSGLGKEMACQLAARHKANLVLTDCNVEPMQPLKALLEKQHGVECQIVPADLTKAEDVDRLVDEAIRVSVRAVILNAGLTYFGRQLKIDWCVFDSLLAVNVVAVVSLATRLASHLAGKDADSGILIISSVAGLIPVPYQALYSGSKAFVTNFGQSLNQELKDTKVSVTVFCPGGIETEMLAKSGLDAAFQKGSPFLQPVDRVASNGIEALVKRKSVASSGVLNKAVIFLSRLTSRKFMAERSRARYLDALRKRWPLAG